MQTYSHLIIAAAINRGLKNKEETRFSSDEQPVGATDYLPHTHTSSKYTGGSSIFIIILASLYREMLAYDS